MKKYGKIIFATLLLLLMLILTGFSPLAAEGVRQGLNLSYRALLPALFPSMVICSMLGELSDQLPFPPSLTVWIASLLCGFPLGIRTLMQGYERGLFTKEEVLRLSCCCSNASPAFLITYIGEGILQNQRDGLRLFLGQLLISFFIGFFLDVFHRGSLPKNSEIKLIRLITESIAAGALGGLQLTGYVTLFATAAALLGALPFFGYLYPFLELCGGISALPQGGRLFWAAAAAGFSGISVFLQNCSYLSKENFSSLPMLFSKLIYAIFLPLLMLTCSLPLLILLLFLAFFFTILHKALTKRKKEGIIRKNHEKGWNYDFFKRDRKNLCLLRARQADPGDR